MSPLLKSFLALTAVITSVFSTHAPHPKVCTAPILSAWRPPAHRKWLPSKVVSRLAGPWDAMVRNAASKAHVSPRLVAAVIHVENHGDVAGAAHRVSSAGAIGPMQLMPTTAWTVLRVNPWNPKQNIDGGARFLHTLIVMFHGDVREALVAYNAGPTITAQGRAPAQSWRYAQSVLHAEVTG